MNLKKLEEMMLMAGVPRSFRKKTIKRLKEDAMAADIRDSMTDASAKDHGTDINPRTGRGVAEKEVKTYSSPFKKGQTVLYGGAKYTVQVPDAQADFVGIVPMGGGKVDLVRASKLRLVEQELKEAKSLEEIRAKIEAEVEYVDVKPYSHNIIGLLLQIAAEEYGKETANDLIEEFGLEELGWNKVTEASKLAKDLVVGDVVDVGGSTRVTVKEVTELKSGEIQFKGVTDDKENVYNFKPERKLNLKEGYKKGQVVMYGGKKHKVEVPDAQADFVGIVPMKGGKVNLVRSSKLKLFKRKGVPLKESMLNEVKGHYVLFTGFRDKELARLVDEKGGNTQSNWNKKTSLVVAKDPNSQSGKAKKAREAGISVISREQLKNRLLGLKEATATDSYAADNMEDLNKQVTSGDLEKLGKKAEKVVGGDKVDTLANSHTNTQDEMTSDDVGNIGGTELKVPANIKSSLSEKIGQLRANATLVRTRDGALADWQDRTANFFDGLLTRLNHGSDENVKMAAVEAQRVTSPMRHELPTEVWDFFVRGGKMRTLSDHFKAVKNNNG